jgi:hypothetical protein
VILHSQPHVQADILAAVSQAPRIETTGPSFV